MKSIVMSTKSN